MILYGTLRDQSRIETDGRISIQAQYTRESDVYPGEMITREIRNEPIIDGAFRVEDLEAGPVIVEITAGAEFSRWELVLPEGDGEHNLADLVDAYVEWGPPIVAAAQAAAAEAQAAAAVVGGAEAVMSAKSEAVAAASSAASSASDAASSASDAAAALSTKADLIHTHTVGQVDGLQSALDGKASLVGGLVPTSQLPAVALTKPQVVGDRAGMLGLTAQEGDVAVITSGDDRGTYMLGDGAPTEFASWVLLAAPSDAVSSVNGQTGVVNLASADVGAAPTSHTHTSAQISDAVSTATASVVIRRDSAGRAQVADPAAAADIATKSYADNLVDWNNTLQHRLWGHVPFTESDGAITAAKFWISGEVDEYAVSNTFVEARTPQINVVSALPSSPVAGVVYIVTG